MSTSMEPKTWDQCAADALRELAECTAYDGVTEVLVAVPNALWERIGALAAAPTQREGATHVHMPKCIVCGRPCCTVEDCPTSGHETSCEMLDGRWVCCQAHWNEYADRMDVPAPEARPESDECGDVSPQGLICVRPKNHKGEHSALRASGGLTP